MTARRRGAGAAAAATSELEVGFDLETHVGHIDLDGFGLGHQLLVDDELVTGHVKGIVGLFWLIQSQRQAGAASTA